MKLKAGFSSLSVSCSSSTFSKLFPIPAIFTLSCYHVWPQNRHSRYSPSPLSGIPDPLNPANNYALHLAGLLHRRWRQQSCVERHLLRRQLGHHRVVRVLLLCIRPLWPRIWQPMLVWQLLCSTLLYPDCLDRLLLPMCWRQQRDLWGWEPPQSLQ
jgi:hypothetical protein